jgi:hypothetical protein
MEQPQDEATRLEVVTQLRNRVNDSLLDIRWNPESYITSPGAYDAYGLPVPPRREGRWEVIRNLESGVTILVWQVREEITEAYRPLGTWLVDYMMKWDRANRFWMDEQKRLFDQEEADDRLAAANADAEDAENFNRFAVDNFSMKQVRGVGIGRGPSSLSGV